MKTYQLGESFRLTRNVKKSGAYHDPATSFTLDIYDPVGTKVVDNQAMVKIEEGKYNYYGKSTDEWITGTYAVLYKAVDGDVVSYQNFYFAIEKKTPF